MIEPGTAREALIVEAMGEAAKLIQQMEALAQVLEGASRTLLQADAQLRSNLAGIETRMAAITENAKIKTVQHLAAHTDDAARRTVAQQTRAMEAAALNLFAGQVTPALRQLVDPLRRMAATAAPSWKRWVVHGVAALAASALTSVLTAIVLASLWRQG